MISPVTLAVMLVLASPTEPETLARIVTLPPLEVSTSRFSAVQPLARTTLGRDEARIRNWGQDTPMALATLPGAYAYSDAGNGVGYSYLSIRGFPQRRISVLVNGVPLNDPESHEVYWIDHPDLLASAARVTVQRGVGSDLYGAAAVGGAVNIETSPFTHEPEQNVTLAYGDFETKRLSVESNSGDLAGGWNTYGRYSRVESFGYREQSWSRLWSYAVSARKVLSGNQSAQLNFYGGPEETHLAYLGVTREDLAVNRKLNPIRYANERDHFFEPHYELLHTWAPSAKLSFSQTLFWFDGRGYYDEQRFGRSLGDYRLGSWLTSDSTLAPRDYYDQNPDGSLVEDGSGNFLLRRTDLVRRRSVVNRHYGWVPRVSYWRSENVKLTAGGQLRFHDGRHFGEVKSGSVLPPGTPPDHTYYDYHPHTMEGGAFGRLEWTPTERFGALADLGYRHVSYSMRGDRFDGIRFEQKYDFASPRVALEWRFTPALRASGSWSSTRREPAFRDLFDAEGVGSVPLFEGVDPAGLRVNPLIRPERVHDFEAGIHWSKSLAPEQTRSTFFGAAEWGVNLFRMDFRDELVFAGQFNTDLGYPILGNAAQSVHQGVEASGAMLAALGPRLRLRCEANATYSDNHFVEFREVYGNTPADVFTYDGNTLGFFPDVMGNLALTLEASGVEARGEVQHVGRIYLDNTETRSASLDPRTVTNFLLRWNGAREPWKQLSIGARVLNAFDVEYEAGGYMDYDAGGNLVPHVIPAATRAVIGEVGVRF